MGVVPGQRAGRAASAISPGPRTSGSRAWPTRCTWRCSGLVLRLRPEPLRSHGRIPTHGARIRRCSHSHRARIAGPTPRIAVETQRLLDDKTKPRAQPRPARGDRLPRRGDARRRSCPRCRVKAIVVMARGPRRHRGGRQRLSAGGDRARWCSTSRAAARRSTCWRATPARASWWSTWALPARLAAGARDPLLRRIAPGTRNIAREPGDVARRRRCSRSRRASRSPSELADVRRHAARHRRDGHRQHHRRERAHRRAHRRAVARGRPGAAPASTTTVWQRKVEVIERALALQPSRPDDALDVAREARRLRDRRPRRRGARRRRAPRAGRRRRLHRGRGRAGRGAARTARGAAS